ncbi:MAG: hypothetical protein QOC60_1769 [Frankiaceae bacterium]|nr:hypothetical protein [Frankiaceae bacterium]
MSNSNVRDTARTPIIDLEISHPPEQSPGVGTARRAVVAPSLPGPTPIDAVTLRRAVAAYVRQLRARRRARHIEGRRGAYPLSVHDSVMYEQVVRAISFRFLK